MKISLLIIGDEVLLGQVIDTNASTIAKILYAEGLEIFKKWTVADQEEEILTALTEASSQSDIILMTGGLGPTKDDITKKTLAKFMHIDLVFSEVNKAHLTMMLNKRNIPVTDLHLQQCYLPANAEVLDNQMGTAMGMWMECQRKIYISLPGVPYEMENIMWNGVLPRIIQLPQPINVFHQTIYTVGMGETEIAAIIEPRLGNLPHYISLSYLPSPGQVRLRLTGKHENASYIQQQVLEFQKIIEACLKDQIIGYDQTTLEAEIGKLLTDQKKSLSIAESCTGGYLAHLITLVPGASEYFKGSIVAYHNEIKQKHLMVPQEIITTCGAVSEECVKLMVTGTCDFFNSDFAIATSGLLGPGNANEEKPIGTVWIAYGNNTDLRTKKFLFSRDRLRNVEAATTFALIEFWKYLKKK